MSESLSLKVVRTIALLSLASLALRAEVNPDTGSYVFRNYSARDFNATADNWMVAQDRRGIIYVANTSAVLQFDGITWHKIPLDGRSAVHSVAVDSSGTVYAGGTGNFGIIQPDSSGSPKFVSLLSKVPKAHRQFLQVWRIVPTPEGVYFSTNFRLFRLNANGTIRDWAPKTSFGRAFSVSGSLYVKTPEEGLLKMRANQLTPVPGGAIFAKEPVEDAVPFAGGALIAAAARIYRMSSSGIDPFPTSGDDYFAKNVIYTIGTLPDGTLAIGTRAGGLVLLDRSGKVKRIVTKVANKSDGLPNNYVSSIATDREGGVWLTTPSGVSRFNPGLTRFDERDGIEGDLRYSLRHRGVFYAGTTAGLFRLKTEDGAPPHFERVPGIANSETVFSLLSHNGTLFAAADHGLYQVSDREAKRILETRQKLEDLSASKLKPDSIYAAGTAALYRLKNIGGSWQKDGELPAAKLDFRTVVEDADGKVWATTRNTILRFDFDQPSKPAEAFGADQGVPPGWISAARFQNHILFATSEGLRQYSEQLKRFAPDQSLGPEFADGRRDVVNLFEDRSGDVWVTGENEGGRKYHGVLIKQPTGYRWRSAPLVQAGIDEIYWMSLDDDRTAWASGSDGVLFRWEPALAGNPDRNFNVLTRRVEGDANGDTLYGGDGAVPSFRLPYRSNSLRFQFASPFFEEPKAVEYQVLLDGYDRDWSPWSSEHLTKYTSLAERSYRFRVRARSPHGTVAEESAFAFEVLAPWYRTWLAYAVYVVLGGFGVWGIVRFRVRQLEEDKRQLEATVADRTVEIRKQRDEIQVQERKSHSLLLNILPAQVADELKATGAVKPVGFDDVTVCFTDFVGFTLSSEKMAPGGLVDALNEYFTAFDEIIARYGLEKLKTIGDSYMFVSGLPVRKASHAVDAVLAALEMANVVRRLASKAGGTGWNIRIGLHSGPVVAGVVGIRKFAFDIWGNTVNFAARMESSGVPGFVNMSERTCRLTRGLIDCESRGNIKIKEGRELPMFKALGPARDFAARYRGEFGEPPVSMPAEVAAGAEAAAR